MEPLDLRTRAPRSCYAELDGLMLMPRTIDKIRALLPGGDPGGYFINGPIQGISGFLLQRLGITEAELAEAVQHAKTDDDVALWLRGRTDAAQYPALNATLGRIKPKHAENEALFRDIYVETLAEHPELEFIIDIIEADDERMFLERP
ncbi:MAG: DUF5069 domain-containing protein [Candidatus Eremiobacteraeota bacterium]|nr:DUF5069 domain-containing protein [Candidatus Eremiobacteraeota bacterium]